MNEHMKGHPPRLPESINALIEPTERQTEGEPRPWDHDFVDNGGKFYVDGKGYFPDRLTLTMDRVRAFDTLAILVAQLKNEEREQIALYFSGQLHYREPEE